MCDKLMKARQKLSTVMELGQTANVVTGPHFGTTMFTVNSGSINTMQSRCQKMLSN